MSDYFLGCLVCYLIGLAVAILYAQKRFPEAYMLLVSWI